MTSAFDDLRFAVVDVEGNGQQPPEIVEIAVVPMDGLTVGEPLSWLVKPSRPISPIVTRKVHGIRNSDVENCPAFAEIAPAVVAALGGRIPVAHNASVEYGVLRRHLPDWSPASMLDTLQLARRVWPGLKSYSLDPLLIHASIDMSGAEGARHRAGFDARATALLLAVLAVAAGDPEQLHRLGCLASLSPQPQPEPAQGDCGERDQDSGSRYPFHRQNHLR